MENNQTKEKLLAEIGRLKKELKKKKKYGLVWDSEREPEEVVEMCKEKLPVLKEVKSKQIITDKNKPINLLIEGDNYHALSVLNYTHKGKIDVIYIDPPYNTGNKDFIYNDSFVDIEDGFRHSKWLSFMRNRLMLAKNLMKDNGLIFISIDDNEQAHLKLLCDQVFGEANFVETIMVEMSNTGGMKVGSAKDGKIAKNGEFILVYSKTEKHRCVNRTPLFDYVPGFDTHFNLYLNSDKTIDKLSTILAKDKKVVEEFKKSGINVSKGSISLKKLSNLFDKSNILQDFVLNNINKIVRPRNEVPIIPKTTFVEKNKWIEYRSTKRDDLYYLTLDQDKNIIQLVPLAFNYRKTDDFTPKYGRSVIRGDFWKGFWIDMGNIGKEGGVEFKNGKKPIRLIRQLLKWSVGANKDATILDFFAGSGTTGQSTMELNNEDNGRRKFILCTSGTEKEIENINIASDITYKRIKLISEGRANNVRYFKTDFVDYKESTDRNKIKLTKEAVEMLCIKEGTFELIQDNEDFKIFKNHDHHTGIIFDQLAIKEFKKAISNIKGKFSVYIFSLGDDTFDDEFEDIKSKVKLSPIPEAILKVYRKIFK